MSIDLTLGPRVSPGVIRPKTGSPIPFERVLLELRNEGPAPARGLRLKLEAFQGTAVICELDEPVEGELAPGEARTWDLYELFLAKGRGFPSKVHLFGVKAALGWDFTVRASAADAETAFRFRWSPTPDGSITAALEALD